VRNTHSAAGRLLAAVVVLLAVSAAAAVAPVVVADGSGDGVATPADGATVSNATESLGVVAAENVTVERIVSEQGTLVVELANVSDPANTNVTVTVTSTDGTVTEQYRDLNVTGTGGARVAPDDLPDAQLANATVSVVVDGETIDTTGLDLRYVVIDGGTTRLNASDQTVRLGTTVSVGNESVDIAFQGNGSLIRSGEARRENGSLIVDWADLRRYFFPPRPFEVTGAADEETATVVATNVRLDPEGLVDESRIVPTDSGVRLSSPVLLNGTRYNVTVAADGRYTTRVVADGESLRIDNPRLANVSSVNVTVGYEGTPVVQLDGARLHPVATAVVPEQPNTTDTTSVNTTALADRLPAGATVTAARVVGTNSSQQVNATFAEGELRLQEIQLTPGDGYKLFVQTDEGVYPVETGETVDGEIVVPSAGVGGGGGDGDGGLPITLLVLAGVAGLVVFAGGGFVVVQSGVLSGPSGGGDGVPVTVEIENPDGSLTDTPVHVAYRPAGPLSTDDAAGDGRHQSSRRGQNRPADERRRQSGARRVDDGSETLRIEGGREQVELPPETHVFTTHDAETVAGRVEMDPRNSEAVTIRLAPQEQTLRVVDDAGDPIGDVDVTIDGETRQTNPAGEAVFELSPDARRVTVQTHHGVYEDTDQRRTLSGDGTTEVRLGVDTGGLVVTGTVDGEPTAGIDVTVESTDDRGVADDTETGETGSDGTVRFDGLVVGEYTVRAEAGDGFTVSEQPVTVARDRTEQSRIDLHFEYELSPEQVDSLATLEDATGELRPSKQLDGAVHHYYGTVIESLAAVIRELPAAGHQFVGVDTDPDVVTRELLDVGEQLLERTTVALNDKRNVDLFTACAGMSDDRPEWHDGYDRAALFDCLDGDRRELLESLRDRRAAADDEIGARRSEVTVDSPVREPFEAVDGMVETESSPMPSHPRQAALSFAVEGYLRATENVFDEQALRERLDSTVY